LSKQWIESRKRPRYAFENFSFNPVEYRWQCWASLEEDTSIDTMIDNDAVNDTDTINGDQDAAFGTNWHGKAHYTL
jgi:hypothetical protein